MQLLLQERKSSVLSPSTLKCLNDTPTLNPTAGCVHICSYCYARGHSNYPGDGTVILYTNLVENLEHEISRKRKAPGFVTLDHLVMPFNP